MAVQAAEIRKWVGSQFEGSRRRNRSMGVPRAAAARVGPRRRRSRGRNRSMGVSPRADPPVNSPTSRLLDLTVAGNGFPGADPVAVEIFGLVRSDIVDVTPEVVN